MQSFREQSSYGNQQTYPPEAHTPSRLEEYNPRQQAQIFQSSYGGRRGGAGTPAAIPPGENANLQSYQSYRKESGDFYYISNKEGAPSGSQTPQRRPPGSVQSYGPPQGNSSSGSSSSSTTGFGTHYGREVHHSQYTGQHSAAGALSQYSQEFTGSFSAAGGQYPTHVPSQQLRQQIYQPHSQSGNTSTTASTPHLPQIQRSASISSPTGYQLRVGQFGQHYQTSSSSSSSAFPNSQRFGQSGAGYEGYSPGSTNTPYESLISGSSFATQQAYSSYTSQHLKGFEASKVPQGGQQQQQPPHIMQYSNTSKMPLQSQVGQYSQSEVPVRSPMQFQQNFSPISNPSPAASVVQSPSCSSTPSPLMTSAENLQCGQGNVSLPSRNRILQMMPQLSPNTHAGGFKNFGTEGPSEKRLTDPGLSSLNALSSQVANLPNTVQHMLLSDALAPHKKTSKRTSRKTDSCANSETSSQAEEHLKSPLAESLDGSCSSSSGDPIERVRQLSGQSTSSETGYKGPSVEKLPSPVQVWQNEPPVKTPVQEIENVPENTEAVPEICKPNEKSVGVIVSMETVANRSEKTTDEILTPSNDSETITVQEVPDLIKDEDVNDCSTSQNGEQDIADSNSLSAPAAGPQTEDSKSPVESGYSFHEEESQNASSLPPKNVDVGGLSGPCDRKPGGGRSEKFPSLLQEVLQGHHQQERRYARSTQEPTTVTTNAEVSLRPNVLVSQTNELPNRSILGKTLAPQLDTPHWGPWDRKPTPEIKQINLNDYSLNRKYEVEPSVSSHESVTSERRSVICDISPLRQLVREPTSSHHIGSGQERPDGRPGQSVILQSGVIPLDAKSNNQTGTPKLEDLDTSKIHRKRIGEHCMPYSTKDSARNKDPASPRSMTYDPNQEYGSQSRASHSRRGTGRVGSRGRSPAQSQDLADKLKMSPGRSRGPTDMHHINQTMSFSERASREAFYSAFFQNTDGTSIGYHTNSRSSSYGEPHPAFTSPLHYKRQMYQQEEYKEWLGNSTQALLSASQHRAEMQRKSPRQEQFPVRSPGRSENEVLNYNQTGTYHDHSSMDFNRPLRVAEGAPNNLALDLKRNNQKTPPGESAHWNHSRQVSPVKKIGSPTGTIQKPFSPVRESDTHGSRQSEPGELAKTGCNAHRPLGADEQSHHNPLIMRRRVRSFISPIPSKRQLPDDRSRTSSYAPKEAFDKTITHVMSSGIKENDFSLLTEDTSKGNLEERSPPSMSLSSPAKTKILPPRKGRGLKLEAIVQKITSPNVRRISTPSSAECLGESVTLDDILSLKIKGPEAGNTAQEPNERSNDVVLDVPCSEDTNVKGLSPKSIEAWITQDDKKIKKEIEEQFVETKDFVQSGAPVPHDTNHYIEGRASSSPLEQKCSMPMIQQREGADKEKLVGTPCPVTPKPEIIPPKGYFPSGKKKGRPIGSVNKQKKQQQLQEQLARTPVEPTLSASSPAEPQTVLEQVSDAEPKPKRRRREGRKPSGTPRRRRGKQAAPIVAPIEPEIKLKYASQPVDKSETKAKPFFPYIHVENKEDLGLACLIINAEDEEQRWKKVTSVRKGQRSTSPQPSSETKALPASSFMVQGPAITESTTMGPLVCCFCGKWANYRNLGDLFGPFYTQEYASTLSKNPPPKKTSETLSAVKVRHKVASHGSKTDSDEEEPQQAREQRSLSTHPRYKRRNRSGDCASSRLSLPSRRKTTEPCELTSVDSTVAAPTADGVPDQGFQVPQLPLDSNEFWMHEGCVLWANGVYLVCGRLYGLQEAIDIAREMKCSHCQEAGATLGCYNKGCACCYHFPCAMDSECLLNEENFSVRCPKHKTKTIKGVTAEQPEQG
uniref:Transcription factor 20 n=1 Tax=Leptobrachium leishanense TaxID=445787 RepID=A0A8C5PTW2_9ANUR